MRRAPTVIAFAYLGAYLALRGFNAELRTEDQRVHVTISDEYPVVYYLFRPISIIDGALTGTRFHVGSPIS